MSRLVYLMLMSVDGYIEDETGSFDWAAPDEEVHAYVNDLARPVGTHLYGRRMYEVMSAWQTLGSDPHEPPPIVDFARLWRAADKVVYSTTLAAPATPRTRIEPRFHLEAVRSIKERASSDLMIGGPGIASEAFRAGLVDTVHLFVAPIVVGGGKPALPQGIRATLTLERSRRFGNGMVHLQYAVRPSGALVR